jgi:hypothetical protein
MQWNSRDCGGQVPDTYCDARKDDDGSVAPTVVRRSMVQLHGALEFMNDEAV